jgi:5S rRNA maturation endonuclease (ribonuclease M5)
LSTRLKDKLEKIEQTIAKLVEESAKGKPVVAEGKKDAAALCELGITSKILTVKTGGKSFLDATHEIERLGFREVILLLDFDRRGKDGTKRLITNLECVGIRANLRFWLELNGLVGKDVQGVESLPSYLQTLRGKAAVS